MMDLISEVTLQYPNNQGDVILDHINYFTQAVLANESRMDLWTYCPLHDE